MLSCSCSFTLFTSLHSPLTCPFNGKAHFNMEDSDPIPRLYPHSAGGLSDLALETIVSRHNHMPHPQNCHRATPEAPTEPPEEEGVRQLEYLPYIELRFSRGPPTGRGFIFGKDVDTCDVVLLRLDI
jgi:hypothetical protein